MYSLSSSHAAQRKSCLDIGVLGAQREMVLATRVSVPGKDCSCSSARDNESEKAQQNKKKQQQKT